MYKVVKEFNGHNVGDVIDLNDRRAKSELSNGNVVASLDDVKDPSPPTVKRSAKVEKKVYENKAYKPKRKTK